MELLHVTDHKIHHFGHVCGLLAGAPLQPNAELLTTRNTWRELPYSSTDSATGDHTQVRLEFGSVAEIRPVSLRATQYSHVGVEIVRLSLWCKKYLHFCMVAKVLHLSARVTIHCSIIASIVKAIQPF